MPLKNLPPAAEATPDTFIVFRPHPNEIAVLQAGVARHFSPAAHDSAPDSPVAPLLPYVPRAAAVPEPPPSAPGDDAAVEEVPSTAPDAARRPEAELAAENRALFAGMGLAKEACGGRKVT